MTSLSCTKKSLFFPSHHRINGLLLFFVLSLSLKEFLPKEYIKQRGAEKKIFQVLEMYRTSLFSSLPSLIY